jgi:serine/threonine-protein kinase RsbW
VPMDEVKALTVAGRLDSLGLISEFVTNAAQDAGLDESAVYAVDMAVDEACANIIGHAYGDEGRGDIEITCRIDEDGLTLVLRDNGRPFDPTKVPHPDLEAPLEGREEGGLGLFLMRHLMDRVEYESRPGSGNVLTMVKRHQTTS